MKLASFLNVLIFIAILWAFVKTVSIRKCLAKHAENDKTATKIINVVAESSVNQSSINQSSVNPPIQKYKETLKPKLKNTKKDRNNVKGKKVNRSEYNKEYYQKNKEYHRNYQKQNKEKINENKRNYYKRNKERIQKYKKMYNQNNREKWNEYQRKYRQEKKTVQSDNNEGTSFVNPQIGDFNVKGKLPIVSDENFEEGNPFNQEEEERNKDNQHQIEVEEPNKILDDKSNTNHMDSNKKILPFDLNEEPDE